MNVPAYFNTEKNVSFEYLLEDLVYTYSLHWRVTFIGEHTSHTHSWSKHTCKISFRIQVRHEIVTSGLESVVRGIVHLLLDIASITCTLP